MLCYKENGLFTELKQCTPRMQAIVFTFNGYCEIYLNKTPVITSVFRDEPESLHSCGRAVDIRAKDWAVKDIGLIQTFINRIFGIHNLKKTCLVHQTEINNRDTLHFHLQDLHEKKMG